jgi:hypothetical protein
LKISRVFSAIGNLTQFIGNYGTTKNDENPNVVGEDSNPNDDLLSDTTPRAMDTVKSWT